MVAPFSKFYGKIYVSFCLNTGKRFFLQVSFSAERAQVFLKNGTRDSQNSPPFERSACFYMWRSVKILNIFSTLTSKQIFQKTKTFLKKLEYSFSAERTKIKKASFPYKTAISVTNVQKNRMVTTQWAYHRERSFARNYFIFLKVLFQFTNLL